MNKNYKEYIFGKKHIKITLISGLTAVATIVLLLLIGIQLDDKLNTNSLFKIISIVIALPISQILNYIFIKKFISKND